MNITVDGATYRVDTFQGGNIVEVYDIEGLKVAEAESSSTCETVCVAYFEGEREVEMLDFSAAVNDLYGKTPGEIAEWLVSTHPSN